MVSISSGKYSLVDQMSVLTHGPQDEIVLNCSFPSKNGNFDFKIKIVTKIDKSSEEKNTFNIDLDKENKLFNFTLVNFASSLGGAGNTTPIELATISGKKLYLRFWCEYISESTGYLFSFYFYLEQ